ncbi:hypothetical protein F5883DRAFT_554459 [Diaporthe sp. PMI_573]|nr:hypothetical protein F5883DRAFT_554459 [Diaporthaceae sp. PMI_573]
MARLQDPQQASGERLLAQLDDALTRYESAQCFSCGGSLPVSPTSDYGDFTSEKKPVTCPRPVIFWRNGRVSKYTTIDCTWTATRDWENSLEELVQDCSPATFGCDDKNVFDEKIRKAGAIGAHSVSTNFNPYDFGIIDAVTRELLPGIVRAGKEPAVERWGIIAELYQLNIYSGPSGMFKSHVDTPRGRTHFGSLVVVLPTEFQGGQERVYLEQPKWHFRNDTIRWVAFYSDCEHEVLPVSAGHRVTLTYHLYVSAHMGGLAQPQLQTPGSKTYPMYCGVKNLLASPTFMRSGGILGFHCSFQYPETWEGTYFYERYPRTLKGIDAVIFAVFRAFGLTVHIKPYNWRVEMADVKTRHQILLSAGVTTGGEPAVNNKELEQFGRGHYVGDEIFSHANWFNEMPQGVSAGAGYLVGAKPTRWLGNEAEVEWDYSFRALFVVVPAFSDRILEA